MSTLRQFSSDPLRIWKIFFLLIILCGIGLRVTDLNRKAYFEVFTALRVSGYDEHDQANPALYTAQPVSVSEVRKFQTFNDEQDLRGTVRGLIRKEPQVAPLYFVVGRARLARGERHALWNAARFRLGEHRRRSARSFGCAWNCFAARMPVGGRRRSQRPRRCGCAMRKRRGMYMLWLALLLAACALCIRAAQTNQWRWWGLYAFVLMLSLYAHALGVFALGALGIYVLASSEWRITARGCGDIVLPPVRRWSYSCPGSA